MVGVHQFHLLDHHGDVPYVPFQPHAHEHVLSPQRVGQVQQQEHSVVEVLQILRMAAQPRLAGGALNVDVLVHALHVVDSVVDAGRDGVDLHLDGTHAGVQRAEALAGTVLVVARVVLMVVHVLLVLVDERRDVVQLHLQVHHLQCQVVGQLRAEAEALVHGRDAILDAAHRLHGGAGVGLETIQDAAVVLPLGCHLLQHKRLLVRFALQRIDPHRIQPHCRVDLLYCRVKVILILDQSLHSLVCLVHHRLPTIHLVQVLNERLVDPSHSDSKALDVSEHPLTRL